MAPERDRGRRRRRYRKAQDTGGKFKNARSARLRPQRQLPRAENIMHDTSNTRDLAARARYGERRREVGERIYNKSRTSTNLKIGESVAKGLGAVGELAKKVGGLTGYTGRLGTVINTVGSVGTVLSGIGTVGALLGNVRETVDLSVQKDRDYLYTDPYGGY